MRGGLRFESIEKKGEVFIESRTRRDPGTFESRNSIDTNRHARVVRSDDEANGILMERGMRHRDSDRTSSLDSGEELFVDVGDRPSDEQQRCEGHDEHGHGDR